MPKSKNNRKRKTNKKSSKQLNKRVVNRNQAGKRSKSFQDAAVAVKRLFSNYSCADVMTAIITSELWMPNISSELKHLFCWRVIAAMNESDFEERECLDCYAKFKSFLNTLYSLVPSFAMLEDFVPQTDWGEIHVIFNNKNLPAFFGTSVERITDYITAFEIKFAGNAAAIEQMDLALTVQSRVIRAIDKDIVGSTENISPGMLLVPSELFWQKVTGCIDVLNDDVLPDGIMAVSLDVGAAKMPETADAFVDMFYEGLLQQALFIRHNGRLYPTALRSWASILMDKWKDKELTKRERYVATLALSKFIEANATSNVPGPSVLVQDLTSREYLFPTILVSKGQLYIPLLLNGTELGYMNSLIEELMNSFSQHEYLEFYNIETKMVGRLQQSFEDIVDKLRILCIFDHVSPSPFYHKSPKEPGHLISLPDFVTLLSAIDQDYSLDEIFGIGQDSQEFMPMTGVIDRLAAYKDADSVLVEGANVPSLFMIDPHYGCNWRYENLKEFWQRAPCYFADLNLAWWLGSNYAGITNINSKTARIVDWFTAIGQCEVHLLCNLNFEEANEESLRILALSTECFADALKQREAIIQTLPMFEHRAIFVELIPDPGSLIAADRSNINQDIQSKGITTEWEIGIEEPDCYVRVAARVDLLQIYESLIDPKDASLQALWVREFVEAVCNQANYSLPSIVRKAVENSATMAPRVTINMVEQTVAVPEFSTFEKALPKHYKLARKELAYTFKELNIQPGSYELAHAKQIIDKARDHYRAKLHCHLTSFNREQFLKLCIEQHDALVTDYGMKQMKVKQSLKHEVCFDRETSYSKAYEEFTKTSRNYRYMIECFISGSRFGSNDTTLEELLTVVGKVDWLLVLYTASDVLHNDIDVGGITIDSDYVPEVFYSESRKQLEENYKRHDASSNLGIKVKETDEFGRITEKDIRAVSDGFEMEFGFQLTLMMEVLAVLSQWAFVNAKDKAAFCYQADRHNIVDVVAEYLNEENKAAILACLDFLTLKANQVRKLVGREVVESDVPVWEHNKRAQRYTIRPLIPVNQSELMWGAATVDKARDNWIGCVMNGYLPSEVESKKVNRAIRKIKEGIEKQLEVEAANITAKFAPYHIPGIDFKRRFQKYNFPDVGDFDVLAYWPESNVWVTIECKYNQPPFCIKDSRRLRDRMFDTSKNKSHLCKIKKRREFLNENFDLVRSLLKWPDPVIGSAVVVKELYVSKNTYWWMFATPYDVPTEFVQLDMLESWYEELSI